VGENSAATGSAGSPSTMPWLDRILLLFANGFGLGYSPLASGTVGALLGIPLVLVLEPWLAPGNYISGAAVVLLVSVFGVCCGHVGEKRYARKDDGRIVIDEIAGYLVTMLWIPQTITALVLGFLFSRFFDVVKPFPAHRSQRLKGGWGIMADDLIAGVYANILLRIVVYFLG
jgi:phosphatidylglycerophosphatase A